MFRRPFLSEDIVVVSFLKKLLAKNKQTEVISSADINIKIKIATCAILVEMANADDDFTEDERDHIIDLLKDRFNLNTDEARELIEIAEEEIKGSIDIYGFTNIIKKNFSLKNRMLVLEEIWRLVFSDGELSGREDSLIHKLSFLLGLTHKQLIDAKIKVQNKK